MAYLLLSESAGTVRLNHESLVDHYGADDVPEVELREVDSDERRVIEMTEPLAEDLVEEGVGERVLEHDYFSGDADAEPADDSDDGDETSDAEGGGEETHDADVEAADTVDDSDSDGGGDGVDAAVTDADGSDADDAGDGEE